MPTNPEHSPSSEPTLQARPAHRDGRAAVDEFDDGEFLYRRYLMVHFVDGRVLPQSISFPKPSFNRSKFSLPQDVLHVDCCDGKDRLGWGVLEGKVPELRVSADSGDNRRFSTYPKHIPESTCYAHSELWCACPPESEDAKPSQSAKEKLRILLSRGLKVRIAASA
jgi:hypothetical protein